MTRRRGKGKAVKKNKTAAASGSHEVEDAQSNVPHSFVIHRGKVGKSVQELTKDFRKVMEPNTASNIKVRPKNVIKDFVHVAGLLKVSHMCSFTKTDLGPYLKLARFPRGPTLTFKVAEYTLARDVRNALKRQVTYDKQFLNHALLILNGFTGEGREIQLMASMFQNLYPSLNVTKVKLNSIRRCVLLNYDAESQSIEFRHYTIKVVPVGLTRSVKKIVQGKVPNLARLEDVSEVIAKANFSESEFEDDDTSKVTLPETQRVASRGNVSSGQSSVRLVELGPRMRLELIKIEEGLHEGDILYHRLVEKTEEEKKKIRETREKRKREKERRKREQDKNVKEKLKAKQEHKKKSLEGMKKQQGTQASSSLPDGFKSKADSDSDNDDDDGYDDDKKWFKEEVGHDPDKELFEASHSRKRSASAGLADSRLIKRFKKGKKAQGPGASRGPPRSAGDKGKRKKQVFNSQGIGPNYDKRKPALQKNSAGHKKRATKKK